MKFYTELCDIASAQLKFRKNNKWQKQESDLPKNAVFETQTSNADHGDLQCHDLKFG